MTVEVFDKNNTSPTDENYRRWLIQHPDGFVINTTVRKSPDYMVLHKATCSLINPDRKRAKEGAFTQRQYIKICADDTASLRDWVKNNGRRDGSFSKECSSCKPI